MENRGVSVTDVVLANADSTTYPFHSTEEQLSSSWSDTTISMYDEDIEDESQQLPDSTTSPEMSGSTTPDNLNQSIMDVHLRSPEELDELIIEDLLIDNMDDLLEEWVNRVRQLVDINHIDYLEDVDRD